jgi:hypothetical protein
MRENQNYYQQLSQERNRKKYVYNPPKTTYHVPKKSPTRVPAPMQQPEHYVNEFQKNQVTEYEIERECDDLFRTTPIPFRPRKGEILDESIAQIVYNQHITIPIVNVKDSQYLIGPEKKTCMLKSGHVLVKVGGGTERFDEYVPRNHRQY